MTDTRALSHLGTDLRLLLACGFSGTEQERLAAIRQALADGVDWAFFARKAVNHGLATYSAHVLANAIPTELPADILDAFNAIIDGADRRGRTQFDELVRLLDAFAATGIDAISFKGPVLAIQAFGKLGLREFRDLDFLVRDSDLPQTIAVLGRLGYKRSGQFTAEQFELIHRLQGQEIIVGESSGIAVEPHTRLTSIKMALDIDYAGLWERARRKRVGGHLLLTFAPEDELLLLALHGGKEMWWNLKWAFDFAAFVRSHPDVDWGSVKKRAGDQGCLRMVLLATSLARRFFHVAVPDSIVAAERQDREIGPMVDRIVEHWNSNEAVFSPDNNSISLDRLRLHDGLTRRIRYATRTMFLPGPHHVSLKWFPRRIGTMSVAVKLAHDMVAMPLWRTYRATAAQMERLPYACASSDFALGLIPASADTKATIRRFRQARAEAERRIAQAATDPLAWRDLGDALSGLGRHKRAIACYDKALSFSPNNSVTWKKRAAAVRATGASQGLPSPPQDSKDARAWAILAARLFGSKRYVEASEASDRALAIEPDNVAAARVGIQARLWACEWHRRDADERRITEELATGRQIIMPFYHRVISDSEEESLIVARLAARGIFAPASPLWRGERYSHNKIRLAYSSTDFRDHVVADVMVGLFEHHDKSRFETTAISLGPDDGSATRRRVVAAFDRFVHAQTESDGGIARLLRDLEIDIVVDLNGNSGDARPGIFGHRAVPLQVTFQGYPGTMGSPFFDYMIADAFTIPPENRQFYSEQIVNMPHTYMPNDNTRPIAERTPTRAEAGLPEEGFVFACHNHEYKISPDIFDIWMRLLKQVDGSVLWLKSVNPSAVINLRREAAAWGVAPERLIFAPRLPKAEDHLARLQLADLFLDTRPYNAHATACDALWAGLPVLTCPGRAFPARVAASVLFAIGLPELVAASLQDYEALALALAHDPQRLAAIRKKLAHNRGTEPLFDTARFARDLESAYISMWTRQQQGLPPLAFAVDRSPEYAI